MTDRQRIPDLFAKTARDRADAPALMAKRNGVWHTTTWREYHEQVHLVARGLMALGVEQKKGVAILGFNCPEWILAHLGAIHAGAVPSGIYTTSTVEQCHYVARHCDAQVVVVENAEYLKKFLAIRDQLPDLRAIVQIYGEPSAPGAISWAELLRRGAGVPQAELDARIAALDPDDVCTLIYTSGTTGTPKAVMITHDNILWTAQAALPTLKLRTGDNVLSYLPLSHIAEQAVSLFAPLAVGGCTWFAESMEKVGDNLREARPHLFLGVPRVWEKIQERMQAVGAESPAWRKKLVAWARRKGLAGGYASQRGEAPPAFFWIARMLVFNKVRKTLGLDRARLLVTAAAPISVSTLEFFLSLGLPICELYGMSECTGPATLSSPARYRTGKAGFPIPGSEMKIAADGEICMRGRHIFKGYYKDPAATAEALDANGWLHSGDIGQFDAEGFLQITDRKKDLIITAGGENVAPQLIEGRLKSIPVISQAVVVGDRQKFLAALLTLDPARIAIDAAAAGSPAHDVQSAATCPIFRAWLQARIDEVNTTLARVQTVKKFEIIPVEFTVEGGELTPSLKVKRKVVIEKYAVQIAALYRTA